jgi:hypothetical protein
MKIAVSIPEEVFIEPEHRARVAMNRVIDEVGVDPDEFSRVAARRLLERVDWETLDEQDAESAG